MVALYKNRNDEMIGLDGNSYGRCEIALGYHYSCRVKGRQNNGDSRFRCYSQFSAEDIYNAV